MVLVLYYSLFRWSIRLQNLLLLLASLLFYAWGEPKNVLLLLASCVMNWLFGLLIHQWKRMAKPLLLITCVLNLGVLGYYKYLHFILDNIHAAAGRKLFGEPEIALPIGISFFTFQAMSYVIDVYRGKVEVQKNPLYVALYIALFPQLIAGPIVRYSTIEDQLLNRSHSLAGFSDGVNVIKKWKNHDKIECFFT